MAKMTNKTTPILIAAAMAFAALAGIAAPAAHAQSPGGADAYRSRLVAESCGTAQLAPVAYGDITQRFGESDTSDVHSRGVTIRTAANASVSAPAQGVVEYAGPAGDLGQVIILNIGRDYRVVMTGLGRVSVRTGQSVAAYTPIGLMPAQAVRGATLYMELRCGEEPVNPEQTTVMALR